MLTIHKMEILPQIFCDLIFNPHNPELLLPKNTKTNPYGELENKTYRQLVGLIVSYNKIISENNPEKLHQLENLGSSFLNAREQNA